MAACSALPFRQNHNGNTIYNFGTANIYDAGFSTGEQISNYIIYYNYGLAGVTHAATNYGINYVSTGIATITGNSIYAVGTSAVTTRYGIYITSGPASGTGHTVTGNYIGGSASLDNIFYNLRTNTGTASGINYCEFFASTLSGTSNYNKLYSVGVSGTNDIG